MKKAIPKTVQLGFLCGLVIIVIGATLPYRNVQSLQSNERWIDHTMKVLQAADALRIAVIDAESGQRGFLLTQNHAYLEPYETAQKHISHQLASLTVLTADTPSQLQNLDEIKVLITSKLEELQTTIHLQAQSKRAEALDLVATNRGKDLMQQIRSKLLDFEMSERKLLSERATKTRTNFQRTFYSFLFIAVLNFLLFAGLYFFILRSFRIKRVAELSLRNQSNLLTSVVNSMSEGLYVIDKKGRTLLSNPVLAEIYGRDVAKFGPEDWQSEYDISGVDGKAFLQEDFPAIKVLQGEPQATAEMVIRLMDSTKPKIIRVSARPIINESGIHEGVVCVSSDITQHKQAELRLRLATQQAEAANKAKSEFVANMSHEIRTPLNAILGIAQLLNKTELAKAQKKYLDMIMLSGKSLLNILNDILDFSKIEAGKMEVAPLQFRLNDVIQSLGTMMSMAAMEKNIELIIDIDPAVPQIVIGDSHRLHQILVNLVGNAIKFTDKGEVAVFISCQTKTDEKITLRFAVKDTGVGMTEAQRERLFSPFTQADASVTRQFGGTGLGLIISRRLAELMDGKIEVTSEPDEGSEFSLVIPFTRCDEIERRAFPRHSLEGLQLLIIDNNESARNAIANHIYWWRWTADMTTSVEEGLEFLHKAQSSRKIYDAILLNWHTGEIKSLTEIRSTLGENTPIILMLNMYAHDYIEETVLSNQDRNHLYPIFKPVISSNLFDTLNEALGNFPSTSEISQSNRDTFRPLANVRLLLVEDNEFNQTVARDLLQHAGAIVDVVDNGQKAMEVLRNNTKNYHAILMDVQMPVMDGFTATQKIRRELKMDVPIIAMTAGVTEREKESCISSGMNDLIAKPIDAEKMVATICTHTSTQAPTKRNGIGDISLIRNGNKIFDVTSLLKVGANVPDYLQKTIILIDNLVNNSNISFELAKNALQEERYEDLAKILHTLRGTLGVIGAKAFSESALALEKLIHDKATIGYIEKGFAAVELDFRKTLEAASNWVKEKKFDISNYSI